MEANENADLLRSRTAYPSPSSGETKYHASPDDYPSEDCMDYSPDYEPSKTSAAHRYQASPERYERFDDESQRDLADTYSERDERFEGKHSRNASNIYQERKERFEGSQGNAVNAYHISPMEYSSDERMHDSPGYEDDGRSQKNAGSLDSMIQRQAIREMEKAIDRREGVGTYEVMWGNRVYLRQAEKRRFGPDSPDAKFIEDRREANDRSPSPTKEEALRRQLAIIDELEFESSHGKELDWKARALVAKKAAYKARLKDLDMVGIMDTQEYESDLLKKIGYSFNKGVPKRMKLDPHSGIPGNSAYHSNNITTMGTDLVDSDGGKIPKIISHVDFMRKLIGKFPDLTKKINPSRRSKNAVDLWDSKFNGSPEDFYRFGSLQEDRVDTDMEDMYVGGDGY